MYVLGIESTCDETAAAVVVDGHKILSSVIHSQVALHAPYGGVYPEVASRAHVEAIIPVIEEALKQAGINKSDLGLISVSHAPGLIGGLLIGLECAKGLSLALNIPFLGINHVEAHLYAAMMNQIGAGFPALGIVLSGGHTLFVKIEDIGKYEILATTIDDALGEAFDKLAVMLGYEYPGGPQIEKLAREGDPLKFKLTAGKIKERPDDFSYSGLKTACRTLIEKTKPHDETFKKDLAASFQHTVFVDLAKKIKKICQDHGLKQVFLGGGVICNAMLRDYLTSTLDHLQFYFAPKALCIDNAAMIAGLGYQKFMKNQQSDPLDLTPKTRTPHF